LYENSLITAERGVARGLFGDWIRGAPALKSLPAARFTASPDTLLVSA